MEQKTTGVNSSMFPLPSSQLLASFVGTVLGEVTEKACIRKSFLMVLTYALKRWLQKVVRGVQLEVGGPCARLKWERMSESLTNKKEQGFKSVTGSPAVCDGI